MSWIHLFSTKFLPTVLFKSFQILWWKGMDFTINLTRLIPFCTVSSNPQILWSLFFDNQIRVMIQCRWWRLFLSQILSRHALWRKVGRKALNFWICSRASCWMAKVVKRLQTKRDSMRSGKWFWLVRDKVNPFENAKIWKRRSEFPWFETWCLYYSRWCQAIKVKE